MAIIKRNRSAQYPLIAEFVFNYTDHMAAVIGGVSPELAVKPLLTDFGTGVAPSGLPQGQSWTTGVAQTNIFEIMGLPVGAQIVGGDLQVEAPYVGPATATVSIGDSSSATMYLAATSVKTAGRTALTIPAETPSTGGMIGNDVRMTLALGAGAATQGRVRVRVMYTIDGRTNEVQST